MKKNLLRYSCKRLLYFYLSLLLFIGGVMASFAFSLQIPEEPSVRMPVLWPCVNPETNQVISYGNVCVALGEGCDVHLCPKGSVPAEQ